MLVKAATDVLAPHDVKSLAGTGMTTCISFYMFPSQFHRLFFLYVALGQAPVSTVCHISKPFGKFNHVVYGSETPQWQMALQWHRTDNEALSEPMLVEIFYLGLNVLISFYAIK